MAFTYDDQGKLYYGPLIADLSFSVGTADNTVQGVTTAFNQTILDNNFRDLGEKINAIIAVLRAAEMTKPD